MSNTTALQTISTDNLSDVTGGAMPKWVKPAAKFAGKKVLGPVSAAWTAYDGTKGYLDARDQGKSVPQSVGEGLKKAFLG
jgi:hypothetical protein